MVELQPCAACRRHVAASDAACPFCGAAVARVAPAPEVHVVGRVSRAAVFATLTAFSSANAEPAPVPQPKEQVRPKAPGAVYGRVVANKPKSPLSGAIVQLVAQSGTVAASATTDRSGRYRINNVAAGEYQVEVRYDTAKSSGYSSKPVKVGRRHVRLDFTLGLAYRVQKAKPYGAPPARRRIV